MKLFINEKVFSLHDKFYVYDELGNSVYEISSKAFSIGKKTTIRDMEGNPVLYLERDIWRYLPAYNVYADGAFICKVCRKAGWFSQNYELSNGYRVEGSCFPLNVRIHNAKGEVIGIVKKQIISLGDKYEIEIFEECYIRTILGIVVSIANDVNRSQRST